MVAERLDQALEGLNAAIVRLSSLIGTDERNRVFVSVVETVWWLCFINDCIFWRVAGYKDYRETLPDGQAIAGLRLVWNLVKHGVDIASIDPHEAPAKGGFNVSMFNKAMFNDRRIAAIT